MFGKLRASRFHAVMIKQHQSEKVSRYQAVVVKFFLGASKVVFALGIFVSMLIIIICSELLGLYTHQI